MDDDTPKDMPSGLAFALRTLLDYDGPLSSVEKRDTEIRRQLAEVAALPNPFVTPPALAHHMEWPVTGHELVAILIRFKLFTGTVKDISMLVEETLINIRQPTNDSHEADRPDAGAGNGADPTGARADADRAPASDGSTVSRASQPQPVHRDDAPASVD